MIFYLAGEITQVKESIPWVRCASGNVSVVIFNSEDYTYLTFLGPKLAAVPGQPQVRLLWQLHCNGDFDCEELC